MSKFLTTKGVSSEIENIIISAKTKIVIVSPYIQISDLYIENLASVAKKGVKVLFICGKVDIKEVEIQKLKKIKELELYFYENLHAKCYFNESKMIITSMNLYDFSEKNNREFGVLVDRVEDKTMFEDAYNEVRIIKDNSNQIDLDSKEVKDNTKPLVENKNTKWNTKEEKSNFKFFPAKGFEELISDDNGFCIRCCDSIEYDIDKPYCGKCFNVWRKYEDPDFEENFCHYCGEEADTTMNKPMDKKCYKKWQKE